MFHVEYRFLTLIKKYRFYPLNFIVLLATSLITACFFKVDFGNSTPLVQETIVADSLTQAIFLPMIHNDSWYSSYESEKEWTQDAHDAQRSGYIDLEPAEPWTLLWSWNGPDAQGGSRAHFYDAPWEARTVTGGENIYVPAGDKGIYALNKASGEQAWHITDTAFNAAPAYDMKSGYLYAGGSNGILYQIDAHTGEIVKTYQSGSSINKAILLANGFVYALNANGELHKIDPETMKPVWIYRANSAAATPAAYSSQYDTIIFCTADLYVHAINNSNGSQRWKMKPTPLSSSSTHTFEGYWPVIAEQHGVVFVRMNLGFDGLWSGIGAGHIYPNTNSETRALLSSHPQYKNLFALDIDNGNEAFIPAIGFGGVEYQPGSNPILLVGSMPVIRRYPDGSEVAYQLFRNGQSQPPDGRWDSHLGEMVLDSNTIPGLVAGDMRFVQYDDSYIYISDEQTPLSMAGNTLFNAHWAASEAAWIVDRTAGKGMTYTNPITTQSRPTVIRRMKSCQDYNPQTHYTTCGLYLFGDSRYWPGPGWWVYWNTLDPPTISTAPYGGGILPRYTYVSSGLIVVEGNGGELMVFRHSGK